ncbi:hypothetical protein BGZ61DRAFT_537105 [Ilyonectria robusta]|uniref:uncharacterized protein n=1 Tax=Ilyonectria robusta TaxID=1079257 RepID=UPI001E8CF48E|nr:uncharacterized protein BGZ61DRAFT_537105 [Ilyonectria robusta]KAH8672478.1 hypothetical protein BGZ61DRAFT_537105 [Ilyonectria robusta]
MKLTYNLLFSLAVGSLAAPHATTTAPQKIRAIWSYAKDDSTTSLKVYNSDKTEFYGETDSSTINSVNFGNFTNKTRARKDLSWGAICNKKFNPTSAEVDCILPGIPGFLLQAIAERTVKEQRQIIPCAPIQSTVAEVISCGSAASFSVGYLESESFTIGFSTSGNPVTIVSDPVIVKSPNSDNRGGGYYCVIGTCRAKGDNYWDNTGPAGGPQ